MARTDPAALIALEAVEVRDRMAAGALDAIDYVDACLARIATEDGRVRAWAWIDPEFARTQARALDARRRSGAAIGPLHGLPVGLKDIIDTRGIPTESGLAVDAGRIPAADAHVVHRLRAAGAIVMGKTVTTEGAFMHPGPTRNPHDGARTPGGSSSGSAAAVAAGMVPLAIGTQTGGSVIRPAAFCGIVGFKPSFGLIGRSGILMQSPSLDTVGVFARSVADAALLAEVLAGHDPADPATQALPVPPLLSTALARVPVAPTFAVVRPPGYDAATPEMQAALDELVAVLGDRCFDAPLPAAFAEAGAARQRINVAEMAKCYFGVERRGAGLLSPVLAAAMEEGRGVTARDYLAALDWRGPLVAGLDAIFDRCDAILTPAATGAAPMGLESTGNPVFNGLWTFCGTPAITLPLLRAGDGMPMGVQLVGRRGDDARLLRTARWLVHHVATTSQELAAP